MAECWHRGAATNSAVLLLTCPLTPLGFQDLYVLNVEKQTWKRIISPNGCACRRQQAGVMCGMGPKAGCWGGACMHACASQYVPPAPPLPCRPLPRTSHQAVCTRTALWVWGGEFTSLNQEKFRHYNDMW